MMCWAREFENMADLVMIEGNNLRCYKGGLQFSGTGGYGTSDVS